MKYKRITEDKKYIPTVTLTKYDKEFEIKKFKTEEEANIYVKKMVKKYKLKRQIGFYGNLTNGMELSTNF